MSISADLYTTKRADFRERIARLAGKSTYKIPTEGRSTAPLAMTDHDIAAALAYARAGSNDIGPDIAYSIICQSDGYRIRIVRELAESLSFSGGHLLRGIRHHVLSIADAAYMAAVWLRRADVPAGLDDRAVGRYMTAVGVGASVLLQQSDEAIYRAERAYRAAA